MPKLHDLIRHELAKPLRAFPAKLTDDMTLEDLGADALDVVTLSMAIEDAFGIALHDRDVAKGTTVGQLGALVARLCEGRQAA